MIYGILNRFLDKEIDELREIVGNKLSRELNEQEDRVQKIRTSKAGDFLTARYSNDSSEVDEYIAVIEKRKDMERKYILLMDYFRNDSKRKFMVKKNFISYLRSLRHLYDTSNAAIQNGILTSSTNAYEIINEVEKCFEAFEKEYENFKK